MHYLLMIVLFVTFKTEASNDFNSFSSLADLLHSSRDQVFSSKQRIEVMEISRKKMVQEILKETGIQSKNELNLSFVKNPAQSALMLKEPWYDVQTEFYSTIHKESFYQRWVDLQKLVHFTEYGKGLYQSMMSHWGHYSPAKEGRFYARWSKISIKSGQRTRHFNLPFFLMSEDINDLIRMENHEPYSELMGSEELKIF